MSATRRVNLVLPLPSCFHILQTRICCRSFDGCMFIIYTNSIYWLIGVRRLLVGQNALVQSHLPGGHHLRDLHAPNARVQDEDATPPLAILQSLDNLGSRLHLDRAIVENMQLSKRIYEVRDAFRNIVQCALASTSLSSDEDPARVPSLATICARLIGGHVQSEIEAAVDESEQSRNGTADDVGAQVIDGLYDEVPAAYRP